MFRNCLKYRRALGLRKFSKKFAEANEKFLQDIKIEKLGGDDTGIVVFGLNRHIGKNSLSKSFALAISKVFDETYFDKTYKVIILKSWVRGIFCAGADLKERVNMNRLEIEEFVTYLRELMFKIENTPVPVIAAIDGYALGGGLEMALACDIRVISESSKIGLVETKLGIIPGAGGTQRLSRLVGSSLAKELIFTARIMDGCQAKDCGIVNHCVPDNEAKDAAYQKSLEIAREILPNGPIGIRMAKLAINKGFDVDINQGCNIEGLCYAQVIPTKDRTEGLMAFVEKRKPHYKGE